MRQSPPTSFDWKFAGLWAISNSLGCFLGGFLGVYATFSVEGALGVVVAIATGFAVSAGVIGGIQQWLLSHKLPNTRYWTLYSVLVASLTTVILNILPIQMAESSKGLIFGLGIGLAQWLILQNQGNKSLVWIPANGIAGSLGFSFLNGLAPFFSLPYSLITALVLVWVLRQDQS